MSLSEQFPWLEGVEDFVDTAGDWAQDIGTRMLGQYFIPMEQRIPGQIDAAATIGQNMGNMAVQGAGALALWPQAGREAVTNALRANLEQYGRQPTTPMGKAYMGDLGALAAPVEATAEYLGEQGLKHSPEMATAGYMTPDILAALTGTGALRPRARQLDVGDIFPETPRIEGQTARPDLFNVEGVMGRGGPGRFQEGAVRIAQGTPDDPIYGDLMTKGRAQPALSSVISRHGNPSGFLMPSIPEALDTMERHRPAQGNAWYKELLRQGVTPEELRFFGMDALEGDNSRQYSKEDIYNMFEQSQNDIEAYRAGHLVEEYTPPATEISDLERQHLAIDEEGSDIFASAPSARETVVGRLMENPDVSDADIARLTRQTSLEPYINDAVQTFSPDASRRRRRPGEVMNAYEREADYVWSLFQDALIGRDAFEDAMAPLRELAERRSGLQTREEAGDDLGRRAHIGSHKPSYHTMYKYPGGLRHQTTRLAIPRSEYGNMDVLAYGSYYPRHLREQGQETGGPVHYQNDMKIPMARSGSMPINFQHVRGGTRALYPKEFKVDEQGRPYVETMWKVDESQADIAQKAYKHGGFNPGQTPEQTARQLEIEELLTAMPERAQAKDAAHQGELDRIRRDARSIDMDDQSEIERLQNRFERAQEAAGASRQAFEEESTALRKERDALHDITLTGLPDVPYKADAESMKLAAKIGLIETTPVLFNYIPHTRVIFVQLFVKLSNLFHSLVNILDSIGGTAQSFLRCLLDHFDIFQRVFQALHVIITDDLCRCTQLHLIAEPETCQEFSALFRIDLLYLTANTARQIDDCYHHQAERNNKAHVLFH